MENIDTFYSQTLLEGWEMYFTTPAEFKGFPVVYQDDVLDDLTTAEWLTIMFN